MSSSIPENQFFFAAWGFSDSLVGWNGMRAFVAFVFVSWVLALTALHAAEHASAAKTADMSESEVASLKEQIAKLSFPVPDFTIERMLPVLVEREGLAHRDGGENDGTGWSGGMIADFWLNDDFVVRVTYGYYVKSEEEHYTLEEQAVVLHRSERAIEKPEFRPKRRATSPSI